jgi:hypothetical protein
VTPRDDLLEALAVTERLAARLRDILAQLAPYLPFDAERVEAVEADNSLLTDTKSG